ncbi:hypothetical protein Droror1_Dr00006487 [Drosera rotundifolia]
MVCGCGIMMDLRQIVAGFLTFSMFAMLPTTDTLGQLQSEYTKRVYNSKLQYLKNIAGTLAMELAEDGAQAAKLSSAILSSASVSSGDWGEHMVSKVPSAFQQYIEECKRLRFDTIEPKFRSLNFLRKVFCS